MDRPIGPGATLGVFGGGQLGRMFCAAANRMGYAVAALDPNPQAPAMLAAQHPIEGEYGDPDAVARLVRVSDAITVEFENAPSESVARAGASQPVRPGPEAVAVTQNRIEEKRFVQSLGIPVAPHVAVREAADLERADSGLFPGLLKSARMGYDGKQQFRVATRDEAAAIAESHTGELVLEKELDLEGELAVIGVRNPLGATAFFPPSETRHRDGILDMAFVPATFPEGTLRQAREYTAKIMEALDYQGVLCVEFFVTAHDGLLANEMAPRPHNSGHHTIESCIPSQFEMQVRALCGLPVPEPALRAPAAMLNLLGQCWDGGEPDWKSLLRDPQASLHIYGKRGARRGRKMGHVTWIAERAGDALSRALAAKEMLYGTRPRIESAGA